MAVKLLHIDSSIFGAASVSRKLSAAVVERITATLPQTDITYRDLARSPLPHLTADVCLAARTGVWPTDPQALADAQASAAVLEEFLAADVVVIGVAFYNFTIASQLKAWVDRIAVAGKTFRYTENGPQGLAGGKRVVLAIARGGHYGPGTPAAALEHAEAYLRAVFRFAGISDIDVIAADGVAAGDAQRKAAVGQALEAVGQLA